MSHKQGPCLRRWDKPREDPERHVWKPEALVLNPGGSQYAAEQMLCLALPPTLSVSGHPVNPACPRLF